MDIVLKDALCINTYRLEIADGVPVKIVRDNSFEWIKFWEKRNLIRPTNKFVYEIFLPRVFGKKPAKFFAIEWHLASLDMPWVHSKANNTGKDNDYGLISPSERINQEALWAYQNILPWEEKKCEEKITSAVTKALEEAVKSGKKLMPEACRILKDEPVFSMDDVLIWISLYPDLSYEYSRVVGMSLDAAFEKRH